VRIVALNDPAKIHQAGEKLVKEFKMPRRERAYALV